jgi:hypothetical protein
LTELIKALVESGDEILTTAIFTKKSSPTWEKRQRCTSSCGTDVHSDINGSGSVAASGKSILKPAIYICGKYKEYSS